MTRTDELGVVDRRRFLMSLGAVGATALAGSAAAKGFPTWRGTVGTIAPTLRPGGLEDLIRLLPEGIGILPLFNDIREGSREEFRKVLDGYAAKAQQLAEAGVDLIYAGGSPPFMVLGYQGERELVRKWEQQFGTPLITSGITQSEALRALKVQRFVGASYFSGAVNDIFAKYYVDAGFEVLAMSGMEVAFDKVQDMSGREIYRFIKGVFVDHPGAEGIYLLGAGWRAIEIIEALEQDLGVPVVHPICAQSWSFQRRLHVRQPVTGHGRLLAEMPAAA
jgi:maleate isomerase